ncbi:MAG: BrnA antitoxin family protein [Nitrospira sp.]|nr:BrnA antitoxin family protein [Nitrospira sp.]
MGYGARFLVGIVGTHDSLKDRAIDAFDIPEQGKAFFKRAVLRLPEPKATVAIRLDQQVLKRFKAKDPDYQTRINALLRAYMEAHKS